MLWTESFESFRNPGVNLKVASENHGNPKTYQQPTYVFLTLNSDRSLFRIAGIPCNGALHGVTRGDVLPFLISRT